MANSIELDATSMENDSFLDAQNAHGKKVRLFKDPIGTLREVADDFSSYPPATNGPYFVSPADLTYNIIYGVLLGQTGNAHRAENCTDEIIEKMKQAGLTLTYSR